MLVLEELRRLLKLSEHDPDPDIEEMLELLSRENLEETDCFDMVEWCSHLPETYWSLVDLKEFLINLLESRQAILTIPKRFTKEAIYFKLRWG